MKVAKALSLATGFLLLIGIVLLLSYFRQPFFLIVNGHEMIVRGRYETVADVIEKAGVSTRPEDYVWPSLAQQPPETEAIVVQHAHHVRLSVDGRLQDVWSHQKLLSGFLAENNVDLYRHTSISVDGRIIPLPELVRTDVGDTIQVSNQVGVVIRDGPNEVALNTSAATVGQALAEANVDIYSTDRVQPPLRSWLRPGLEITVERAVPVTIQLEGQELDIRTEKSTVSEILAEAGIGLTGTDSTSPPLDHEIGPGEAIKVLRNPTSYQVVESPLAHSSRLQPLETLEIDQRSLVSVGTPGTESRLMRIEPGDSADIGQTLVGAWVSLPPVDEVIGYGTNITVKTLETPDGTISYWRVVRMRASAYTAADAGRPPTHPSYGITASGRRAGYGIVAIDPNVVPFRSQVYVPGYGIGFAGDTGGRVKGRWIDLGYNEGEIVTWNGYVDVYYLTPVPDPAQINYLIPSALP